MWKIYMIIALVMLVSVSALSQSKEVEVSATIDNTIFKDLELSNGAGQYIFTGTTKVGVTKRALVQFDLESKVPEDAIVDSSSIIMIPSKVKPGSTLISVYMLSAEWGEGTSAAEDGDGKGDVPAVNDATWIFSKFKTDRWVKKGGDFAFVVSDTTTVVLGEESVFSSSGITENVRFWLQEPTKNFGWIFIGDEANTQTSVKFASKDHSDNNMWPKLRIYYQSTTSAPQTANTGLDLKVYQGVGLNSIVVSNPGDPGECSMEVYSITGTRVFSNRFQLFSGNNTIETGIHDPGIYLYRIIQNQKTASGKLVISN